jgi:hypothetical protein
MKGEWSDWIAHPGDGRPNLATGTLIECEGMTYDLQPRAEVGPLPEPGHWAFGHWDASCFGTLDPYSRFYGMVIRYRWLKPRALLDMIERAKMPEVTA